MPGPRPHPRPAPAGCRPPPQRGGFTLLELVIVLGVAAVLCAMAVPSLAGMVTRHRLLSAAHHLQADLTLARHEALRSGRAAHVSFRPGTTWCYALSLDAPVDCAAEGRPPGLLKRVRAEDHPQVLLLSADPMVLDGPSGLPPQSGAQAVLATAEGARIALRLGPLGRASVCAASGVAGQLPRCAPRPPRP
jgi:prepilin-type N-terminal cleavage/methylation domain-containing protein